MATLAVILQDRQHVFIEHRRRRHSRLLKSGTTKADPQADDAEHASSFANHAVILQA
jgi:hypothetical protein